MRIINKIKKIPQSLRYLVSFFVLLNVYLMTKVLLRLTHNHLVPSRIGDRISMPISRFYLYVVSMHRRSDQTLNRVNLIELALKNMRFKKTRTIITIGGMSIGIASIVFLISIGYGVQQLVINRVARLDEMRQADINRQAGSKTTLDDQIIAKMKQLPGVETVLPLIAVVGRININNSVSDMAVFGVTTDYLRFSAIKTSTGKLFDSNEIANKFFTPLGEVAGVETEVAAKVAVSGQEYQPVKFSLMPNVWYKVRSGPHTASKILGYTRRDEGTRAGYQYWGDSYQDYANGSFGIDESGKPMGLWLKADFPVLKTSGPTVDNPTAEHMTGYVAQLDTEVLNMSITTPEVLGEATPSATTGSGSGSGIDWVEIASVSAQQSKITTHTVPLGQQAKKLAVINTSAMRILGLKEADAVNKTVQLTFIVPSTLRDSTDKVVSEVATYSIVGVVPDDKSPVIYTPFIDLRSLGITNYSQVRVVVKNQEDLAKTRQLIESMGLSTTSVADTVADINSLFVTARALLALLGLVALAVASLGMFNTLTVSLLERIHEVGLMKAMGMKSNEIQELFLTESMIMGFFGGLLGLVIGFLSSKLISLVLSVFSVFKGADLVDVSYTPIGFVIAIISLSLFVGFVTGIYPARRATRISALDALRYE